MIPSDTATDTIPPTTAEVAATPTPSAVDLVRIPAQQPTNPTSIPKKADFASPKTIMNTSVVSATSDLAMEIVVTRLALDCRAEGRRDASVALAVALVGGRSVVSTARGEASAPVGEGDFSAAFSKAFEEALLGAVRSLR